VVEHHRAGAERLADRLAGGAVRVEVGDGVDEVLRLERVDRLRPDQGPASSLRAAAADDDIDPAPSR
jgi:hypothetical protein